MDPGGSMLHSQGLSNNPSTQFLALIPISLRSILILSSHLRLGLPKDPFPAGVSTSIFHHTHCSKASSFFILLPHGPTFASIRDYWEN